MKFIEKAVEHSFIEAYWKGSLHTVSMKFIEKAG